MITNKIREIIATLKEEEIENVKCYNIESALTELIKTLGYETLLTKEDDTMFELVGKFNDIFPDLISRGEEKYAPSHISFFGYLGTNLDYEIQNLDTSNLTNMYSMFRDCESLTSLDLSSFDTSNVTAMDYMFKQCSNLIELDLSSFDTSKVTDMSHMFESCTSLEELDVSHFDTSNVDEVVNMFTDCVSLIRLDLSGWDTSKILSASGMFYGCHNLEILDIRTFTFSTISGGNSYIFGELEEEGAAVPAECLIIVKDATEKQWVETNFDWLTNVKTAEEYEASL